jgi:lipoprotein signal peptidase
MKKWVFWICFLVIVDQTIKMIINKYYLDINISIIPSLLEFRPTFNDKYNYLGSLVLEYSN